MKNKRTNNKAELLRAEWQAWIAENLAQGVLPEEIKTILIAAGVAEPVAQDEISKITAHPIFLAAEKIALEYEEKEFLRTGNGEAPAPPPIASHQASPEGPLRLQVRGVQDTPTTFDTLGFKPYTEALSAFLSDKRTQPPLTLSIEGPWGSGKSSFMLQLEESLGEKLKPHAKFVRFNAWKHEKGETLWSAFALDFSTQLINSQPWFKRRLSRLSLGISRLSTGRGWLPLLKLSIPTIIFATASWFNRSNLIRLQEEILSLASLALIPLSIPVIGSIWKFFGNPLAADLKKLESAPDYETRITFLDQFHEDFKLVIKNYTTPDDKIFAFIEDLDRCELTKSAELIQAINLMIPDSSKIVFILGIDREKLAAGIALRNEKLLPFLTNSNSSAPSKPYDTGKAIDFGYDSLEKFIQIPFQLPRPTEESVSTLLDLLLDAASSIPPTSTLATTNNLTGSANLPHQPIRPLEAQFKTKIESAERDSPEIKAVMLMVAPAFDFNPRRLKQFLNIFRLNSYIAVSTGLLDYSPSQPASRLTLFQLGKYLALALRWPRLLSAMEKDPHLCAALEAPLDQNQPSHEEAKRWSDDSALMKIVSAGIDKSSTQKTYSLSSLDLKKLRSTTNPNSLMRHP